MKKIIQSIIFIFAVLLVGIDAKADVGIISITGDELECLALNMYHEARGEGDGGEYVPAIIALNRVLDVKFPSTICEVVYQSRIHKGVDVAQFSWTNDKLSNVPKNKKIYSELIDKANELMFAYLYDEYELDTLDNALYYHESSIKPRWDYTKLIKVAQIDNHIIYKDS